MKEKVRILGEFPGHWVMVERVVRTNTNNARYGYVLHDKRKVFVRKVTSSAKKAMIFGGAQWVSLYKSAIPSYKKGDRVAITFQESTPVQGSVAEVHPGGDFQSLTVILDTPHDHYCRYIFSSSAMEISPHCVNQKEVK